MNVTMTSKQSAGRSGRFRWRRIWAGGWLLGACLTVAVSGRAVLAQSPYYYPPTYQAKAATAEESVARGFSEVVRAAGETNLRNSEAAKNWEQARAANFENRIKYTEMYFERKRLNKEYRQSMQQPRPSSEDLFRLAKKKVPKRMSPSELDPLTGKIEWPPVLREEDYKDIREQIDMLFVARAVGGEPDGLEWIQSSQEAVQRLKAQFQEDIKRYPPQMYSSAYTFLNRLEYEARF